VTGQVTVVFSEQVEKQAGVFSRRQALNGGHAASAIDARVRRGTWQVVYPGVYTAAASQLSEQGRLWAVVLYAGRGALLSHETAAWLHGFCDRPADVIHVTIPVERRVREPDGVHVHRSARVIAAAAGAEDPPRMQVEETVLDLVNESASAADAGAWAIRAIQAGVTDGKKLLTTAGSWKKLRWRTELDAALSG
jgi:predicted transcriptional regulator of viral defense system